MQIAFPAICQYGFNHLQLNRIEALVESQNVNCIIAIEPNNFILEGAMREYESRDRRYVDLNIYARWKGD